MFSVHLINVLHSSWRICYPPMLSIRVCNPKEPRTVSCRTLRERSLHNMPCPLYSTVVFNLITLFFNSFCSLSFMYFLYRQNQRSAPERAKAKVPKSSAHGKNLHKSLLLRPHNLSLRSRTCSSLQAFACFQGAAKLNFV